MSDNPEGSVEQAESVPGGTLDESTQTLDADNEGQNSKNNTDGSSTQSNPSGIESSDTSTTGVGTFVPTGSTNSDQDSSTPEKNEPSDTGDCVDGATAECHELENGSPVVFPSGAPLGGCKLGSKVCENGIWGRCKGTIPPASEDKCDVPGDDSDCDGVPNSGCACIDGETRPCGHNDVGECKMGTQSCTNGKWSDECVGAVLPKTEVCDGKRRDEDCNGAADLDDARCDCVDGDSQYCERGGQKGDCKWGKKTCASGKWTKCAEWARPIDEICGERVGVSGVRWTGDEDCDGGVDTSPFGQPGPTGCVRMMMDADGDGYGRIGKDLSQMVKGEPLAKLATACLCTSRPDMAEKYREGWTRLVTGRANKDCGDCNVDGDLVKPTTPSNPYERKFLDPSRCLQDLGYSKVYDYNCDGVEEPEYTGEFSCDFDAVNGTCVKTGHWYEGEQPGCGKRADHVSGGSSCRLVDDNCESAILGKLPSKRQSCG